MKVNVDLCEVVHSVVKNKCKWRMYGNKLAEVQEEKDLGSVISNDIKCTEQGEAKIQDADRL